MTLKQDLKKHIDNLMARGATYVDARWYPYEETNSLLMWNGNLKDLSASSQSGVGVRVLYRGA
jgi:predicted Zn-dependent protease